MKPAASKDLSKLQVICALLADSIGGDLYLARQIKDSIEAALPEEQRADPAAFLQASQRLASQMSSDPEAAGIGLVPAFEAQAFSILALRARLLEAVKKTCRYQRPLLVLPDLREAICPPGARWTPRRKQEYQDALDFTRDFCNARSRPSSQLSLVIF